MYRMVLLSLCLKNMLILGFVAAVLFATPVRAQEFSADSNYLLGSCQITVRVADNPGTTLTKYEAWRDGYCRGIVEGVGQASPLVCPTDGVITGQMIRVVVKFMQDHPERLNLRGTMLVNIALSEAFPCSK